MSDETHSKELLEEIRRKADEEKTAILGAADEECRRIETDLQAQIDTFRRKAMEQLERELPQEIRAIHEWTAIRRRNRQLVARQALIDEVFDEARRRIGELPGTGGYGERLCRLIVSAAAAASSGQNRIEVSRLDRDSITASPESPSLSGVTIVYADRERGSVVAAAPDGSRMVDNGFQARLRRAETSMRAAIAELLFGADETDQGPDGH
jgi:vacuolar-type H+-ATPase subunit E/Vma4